MTSQYIALFVFLTLVISGLWYLSSQVMCAYKEATKFANVPWEVGSNVVRVWGAGNWLKLDGWFGSDAIHELLYIHRNHPDFETFESLEKGCVLEFDVLDLPLPGLPSSDVCSYLRVKRCIQAVA